MTVIAKTVLDRNNNALSIGDKVACISKYNFKLITGSIISIGDSVLSITNDSNRYNNESLVFWNGQCDAIVKVNDGEDPATIEKNLRKLRYKATTDVRIVDGVTYNTMTTEKQNFVIGNTYFIRHGLENEFFTGEYVGFDKEYQEYTFEEKSRTFCIPVHACTEAMEV